MQQFFSSIFPLDKIIRSNTSTHVNSTHTYSKFHAIFKVIAAFEHLSLEAVLIHFCLAAFIQ